MANITTPASLTYTGGTLRTSRLVPARLTFSGSTIAIGNSNTLSDPATTPNLTTQKRFLPIGRVEGGDVFVTIQEQERQQRFKEAIEAAFVAINARIDLIALEARVSAVEVKAETANDNAVAAQATADNVSSAVQSTFQAIDPLYDDLYEDALNP